MSWFNCKFFIIYSIHKFIIYNMKYLNTFNILLQEDLQIRVAYVFSSCFCIGYIFWAAPPCFIFLSRPNVLYLTIFWISLSLRISFSLINALSILIGFHFNTTYDINFLASLWEENTMFLLSSASSWFI